MVKWFMVLGAAAVALSGCAPVIYGESRKVNKEAIMPVIAAQRPDVPQDAGATCIVKGMTMGEVLSNANSPMIRQPDAMGAFVGEVTQRPGVAACLDAAVAAGGQT